MFAPELRIEAAEQDGVLDGGGRGIAGRDQHRPRRGRGARRRDLGRCSSAGHVRRHLARILRVIRTHAAEAGWPSAPSPRAFLARTERHPSSRGRHAFDILMQMARRRSTPTTRRRRSASILQAGPVRATRSPMSGQILLDPATGEMVIRRHREAEIRRASDNPAAIAQWPAVRSPTRVKVTVFLTDPAVDRFRQGQRDHGAAAAAPAGARRGRVSQLPWGARRGRGHPAPGRREHPGRSELRPVTALKGVGEDWAARSWTPAAPGAGPAVPARTRYEDRTRVMPIGALQVGTRGGRGRGQLTEVIYRRRRQMLCRIADGSASWDAAFSSLHRRAAGRAWRAAPGSAVSARRAWRTDGHGDGAIPSTASVFEAHAPMEDG